VGKTAREGVQNTHLADELKQRMRTEWSKLGHVIIAAGQPFLSGVIAYQWAVKAGFGHFEH